MDIGMEPLSNERIHELLNEERPCCQPKRRKQIDEMFQHLPADSYGELAERLGVTEADVTDLISHLRRNSTKHGWTIPHARRGKSMGEQRYVAVLVNTNGQHHADKETIGRIRAGAKGTLRHSSSLADNEAAALEAFAEYCTPSIRRHLLNVAEDFRYVGRKTHGILSEVEEEEASSLTG